MREGRRRRRRRERGGGSEKLKSKRERKRMFIYIYIYIYRERYIERERESFREKVIYIYIYIYIYHNSSVWLDTRGTPSRDRKPPNFTSGWQHTPDVIYNSTSAREFSAYVSTFVCLHSTLSVIELLNSLEELFITRVATFNSLAKVLTPPSVAGAYILSSTDKLFMWWQLKDDIKQK